MGDVEEHEGRFRFRYKDAATARWRYKTVPRAITTKSAAREWARAFLTQMAKEQVGLAKASPNPHRWNVWQMVEWWLRHHVEGRLASASTVEARCRKHLKGARLAQMLVEHVKSGDIERWLDAVARTTRVRVVSGKRTVDVLKPQTINNLRSHLQRAWMVALSRGEIDVASPFFRVEKRKAHNIVVEWLTKAEVCALLEAAVVVQPRHAPFYAVAVYTGMRKGEMFALRWEDVDVERGLIVVRRSHERRQTKGGRARTVFIPSELRPWLDVLHGRANGPLVFPGVEGQQRERSEKMVDRLGTVLRAAGIARHIRLHDLRHTFASLFLQAGGDIVVLQELLGHSSIELTRSRYGHLSRAHVRAQHEAFTLGTRPPLAEVAPDEGVQGGSTGVANGRDT